MLYSRVKYGDVVVELKITSSGMNYKRKCTYKIYTESECRLRMVKLGAIGIVKQSSLLPLFECHGRIH